MNVTNMQKFCLGGDSSVGALSVALTTLEACLPKSLPVYRRLQSGDFTEHSWLLLAGLHDGHHCPPCPRSAWLIAFVDSTYLPETEAWPFGSWDGEGAIDDHMHAATLALVGALTVTCKELKGEHGSDMYMRWGAVHEQTFELLNTRNMIVREGSVAPDKAHLFLRDELPPAPTNRQPKGVHWGKLKSNANFDLARSKSPIDRERSALAKRPNCALFQDTKPVAWVFFGADASPTALHVVEQHRRQRLAEAVVAEILRANMSRFSRPKGVTQVHVYVAENNDEGKMFFSTLGWSPLCYTYWFTVDLSRAMLAANTSG